MSSRPSTAGAWTWEPCDDYRAYEHARNETRVALDA